ncbi:MAG: AraC family transcriptional regulator [Cyanobacteria bacterium P01_C01_bin.120]
MTIFLTRKELLEQLQEADERLHIDASDELDVVLKHNGQFCQGWIRYIYLRKGILLRIHSTQMRDRLVIYTPEFENILNWQFWLSGKLKATKSPSHRQANFSLEAGRYIFSGNGSEDCVIDDISDKEAILEVKIAVQPDVLRSFVSDSSGELPQPFNHLVPPHESDCYKRVGKTPPMVNRILHQIIQCSRQGLTKRIYLESKATEIMALMLEEEAAVQQGEFKTAILQRDRLDRIHHAKEILLKDLKKSPTLDKLACQAGMCEYSLKRDFKEVFGTTVYGYLRDRRLEKAQQLLLDGQMKVAAVARAVGYDSPTSFNAAFKRKFGVSPKAYQLSVRK